jgi:hypothetical protein
MRKVDWSELTTWWQLFVYRTKRRERVVSQNARKRGKQVVEPATLALLGLGVVGLVIRKRS